MTYQLGYEIEFCGLTPTEVSRAIQGAGVGYGGWFSYHGSRGATATDGANMGMRIPRVRDIKMHPNNPNATVWVTENDGSLRNTAGRGRCGEVVSPVLYGKAGMNEAKKVHRALVAAGAQTNSSCGNHIHMGINHNSRWKRLSVARKAETGARVAYIYSHFQPVINALLSNVRATGGSGYGDSVRAVNLSNPFNGRCVLNMGSFILQGRLEFRQPGYTLEWDNVEGITLLFQSIIGCALNDNHRSHVKGWANFVEDLRSQPISLAGFLGFLNAGRKAEAWAVARLDSNISRWSHNRAERVLIRDGTWSRPTSIPARAAFYANGVQYGARRMA